MGEKNESVKHQSKAPAVLRVQLGPVLLHIHSTFPGMPPMARCGGTRHEAPNSLDFKICPPWKRNRLGHLAAAPTSS